MVRGGGEAYVADVDADGFTGWTDFAGGLEDVEAAAAAEVDDGFALVGVSWDILILGWFVGNALHIKYEKESGRGGRGERLENATEK